MLELHEKREYTASVMNFGVYCVWYAASFAALLCRNP